MNGASTPGMPRGVLRRAARGAVARPAPAACGPAPRWDVVHTHGMRANLPVRMIMPEPARSPLPLHDRALRPAAGLRVAGARLRPTRARSRQPRRRGRVPVRLREPAPPARRARLSGASGCSRCAPGLESAAHGAAEDAAPRAPEGTSAGSCRHGRPAGGGQGHRTAAGGGRAAAPNASRGRGGRSWATARNASGSKPVAAELGLGDAVRLHRQGRPTCPTGAARARRVPGHLVSSRAECRCRCWKPWRPGCRWWRPRPVE